MNFEGDEPKKNNDKFENLRCFETRIKKWNKRDIDSFFQNHVANKLSLRKEKVNEMIASHRRIKKESQIKQTTYDRLLCINQNEKNNEIIKLSKELQAILNDPEFEYELNSFSKDMISRIEEIVRPGEREISSNENEMPHILNLDFDEIEGIFKYLLEGLKYLDEQARAEMGLIPNKNSLYLEYLDRILKCVDNIIMFLNIPSQIAESDLINQNFQSILCNPQIEPPIKCRVISIISNLMSMEEINDSSNSIRSSHENNIIYVSLIDLCMDTILAIFSTQSNQDYFHNFHGYNTHFSSFISNLSISSVTEEKIISTISQIFNFTPVEDCINYHDYIWKVNKMIQSNSEICSLLLHKYDNIITKIFELIINSTTLTQCLLLHPGISIIKTFLLKRNYTEEFIGRYDVEIVIIQFLGVNKELLIDDNQMSCIVKECLEILSGMINLTMCTMNITEEFIDLLQEFLISFTNREIRLEVLTIFYQLLQMQDMSHSELLSDFKSMENFIRILVQEISIPHRHDTNSILMLLYVISRLIENFPEKSFEVISKLDVYYNIENVLGYLQNSKNSSIREKAEAILGYLDKIRSDKHNDPI